MGYSGTSPIISTSVLCFEIRLTRTVGEPLDFSWRLVFSSISEEAKTDPENKNSKVFSA